MYRYQFLNNFNNGHGTVLWHCEYNTYKFIKNKELLENHHTAYIYIPEYKYFKVDPYLKKIMLIASMYV